MEICKGIPGLKQGEKIVNDQIKLYLAKHSYTPVARTPSLRKHKTRDIAFSLVVGDFGVKYVGEENAKHLLRCLEDIYTFTTN